jgi:hypothetical protein
VSRALLTSGPVVVTLLLAVLIGAYWGWSNLAGARKLTDAEIARAAETGNPGKLDIRVVLPFTLEQFHFMRLQEIGRMAGADANSVNLRGVPVAAARTFARHYWVADIVPLDAQ